MDTADDPIRKLLIERHVGLDQVNQDLVALVIDAMRRMLSAIEPSGMDGDEDSRGLIDTLDRLPTTPQDAAAPPSAIRVDVARLDKLMNLSGRGVGMDVVQRHPGEVSMFRSHKHECRRR